MSSVSSAAKWGAKPPDWSGAGTTGAGTGTSASRTSRLALLAAAAASPPKQGGGGAAAGAGAAQSTSGGATSTSYSYSTAGSSGAVIGPLPTPKTITMTLVPDWNQQELKSPLRPASVCVVLGPANTLPQHAHWSFEFNISAMDQLTGPAKKTDEEAIGKGSRALLWWGGKPFPKHQHAVVPSGCRLSTNDDLKTLSIVLRTYSEEKDPNALLYVRKKAGVPKHESVGYLKVIQGHHYYLNITFAAGSTIAQLVGLHSWRPMVYLSVKKPEKTNTESITGSRLFTNFVTKQVAPHVARARRPPSSFFYPRLVR